MPCALSTAGPFGLPSQFSFTSMHHHFFLSSLDPSWPWHCFICCCYSVAKSCLTLCDPHGLHTQSSSVLTISRSLLKLMSMELVMPSSAISSSAAHFSSCLQSFPASKSFPISQLFTSGGQSIGVSASASILVQGSNSGLLSFRIDWFDLLAVKGTLNSLLRHRKY